ncbi:Hypothetical protein PP7435_CHR3-2546 [Komagataella phaffii CBS 7435]|uniref:Uncharacterized protein n=1 Tax=Komagataella phaffii (strain ATCC 76273 / CBS 7435 / CECT 11047 / NRRL Y-11430 / Wegner 21-1) TaxID=981350 RepID=A0A1G4KQK5_KOMPC|nr:Hypothetical protein BQ9382_C3-5092 [Komagataella phaffii CBS 7435]SCV12285.1 Hypothetical protein PP7435_CHR3-2546 [Komagataella phaffii CBS 7435]
MYAHFSPPLVSKPPTQILGRVTNIERNSCKEELRNVKTADIRHFWAIINSAYVQSEVPISIGFKKLSFCQLY